MISGEKTFSLFIGLSGIGMSALALALVDEGYSVSGLDHHPSEYMEKLESRGVNTIRTEQDIDWDHVHEVIHTSAVAKDNPLLVQAEKRGLPVKKRGEKLAELMNASPCALAVTGTHGKTTTAALLAHMFIHAERGARMYLGGLSENYDWNYVQTGKDYFISEVDESDRTMEHVHPHMALVTNIEFEHIDRFPAFEDLLFSFRTFLSGIKEGGTVFFHNNDTCMSELVCSLPLQKVAISRFCDPVQDAVSVSWDEEKLTGLILLPDQKELQVDNPSLMGWYNLENAALAAACAFASGISVDRIQAGLNTFQGVKRRFEVLGQSAAGLRYVSDYAHHPTEVLKVLQLARSRSKEKKICVVFQPHRISRLQFFYDEFARSLSQADRIIVTEIYMAGEKGDAFQLPRQLVKTLSETYGKKSSFCRLDELDRAVHKLSDDISFVLFLGAGTIDRAARDLMYRNFKEQ